MPTPLMQNASRLNSMSLSERWSLANAAVLLAAGGGALWSGGPWPLVTVGIGMLAFLAVAAHSEWTPGGPFGTANSITAVRIGLLALLPPATSAGSAYLIGLSLMILALDGLDGWLARHYTLSSEFGSYFDKETDALFLLLLCSLATFRGPLGDWILAAGLLRYAFVVLLFILPTPKKSESRSTWARYIYSGMIVALLVSFLPYPAIYRPLIVGATAALVLSFGHSLWRIVAPQKAFGNS